MPVQIKKVGHCTACGERVFDPKDDPKTWDGKRVTYELTNGSLMDLFFCDDCAGDAADSFVMGDAWDSVLLSWEEEGQGGVQFAEVQRRTNKLVKLMWVKTWDEVMKDEEEAVG